MKPITCIATLTILALLAPLSTHAFEGKATFAVSTGRDKMTLRYAFKPDRVRMEMSGLPGSASGTMIYNLAKREMLVLLDSERMYMKMPIDPAKLPSTEPDAIQDPASKLQQTGRQKEILGYLCEEFILREADGVTQIWLTKSLGPFLGISGPAAGASGAKGWEQALSGQPYFPLSLSQKNAAGREVFTMDAQSIEPGTLPDTLFLPPDGYQPFSLPALPGLPMPR